MWLYGVLAEDGRGSPFSHWGPHFPGKMGTRGPHFHGGPQNFMAPVPVRKDVTQSRKPHPLTHQIVFLSRWRRYCSTGGECCATVCARTLCKADRPTHSFVLQEVIESEREYVRRLQMATEVSSCPEIGSSSAVLHGNSGFY